MAYQTKNLPGASTSSFPIEPVNNPAPSDIPSSFPLSPSASLLKYKFKSLAYSIKNINFSRLERTHPKVFKFKRLLLSNLTLISAVALSPLLYTAIYSVSTYKSSDHLSIAPTKSLANNQSIFSSTSSVPPRLQSIWVDLLNFKSALPSLAYSAWHNNPYYKIVIKQGESMKSLSSYVTTDFPLNKFGLEIEANASMAKQETHNSARASQVSCLDINGCSLVLKDLDTVPNIFTFTLYDKSPIELQLSAESGYEIDKTSFSPEAQKNLSSAPIKTFKVEAKNSTEGKLYRFKIINKQTKMGKIIDYNIINKASTDYSFLSLAGSALLTTPLFYALSHLSSIRKSRKRKFSHFFVKLMLDKSVPDWEKNYTSPEKFINAIDSFIDESTAPSVRKDTKEHILSILEQLQQAFILRDNLSPQHMLDFNKFLINMLIKLKTTTTPAELKANGENFESRFETNLVRFIFRIAQNKYFDLNEFKQALSLIKTNNLSFIPILGWTESSLPPTPEAPTLKEINEFAWFSNFAKKKDELSWDKVFKKEGKENYIHLEKISYLITNPDFPVKENNYPLIGLLQDARPSLEKTNLISSILERYSAEELSNLISLYLPKEGPINNDSLLLVQTALEKRILEEAVVAKPCEASPRFKSKI